MLTDERIAEIRARRNAVPKRVFYLSVQVVDCTDADHAVLTDCLLRAPADLTDLLQHADALAAENRRLRAALTTLANPDGPEFRDEFGAKDPLRMRCFARRALEEE